MEEETVSLPRWLKVVGGLVVVVVAAALAFTIVEPIKVLPRVRLAPGYALAGQDGATLTSEDGRGGVTLYTFAPTDCGPRCDGVFATMAEVRDRAAAETDLGDARLRLVTVALDPVDDPSVLAAAAERSGADGDRWRWVGGDGNDVGTTVGVGFRWYVGTAADGSIEFDPGFVLVDGGGVVRGEYRFQTPGDDADKLVRHIAILGDEIRNSGGATAVAYEAAHLFMCYP